MYTEQRINNLSIQILMFILVCSFLSIQTDSLGQHKIGVTYSAIIDADVARFTELDGAATYDAEGKLAIGIVYLKGLNKWLDFQAGVEYTKYDISSMPMNIPPTMDIIPKIQSLSLFNIPVGLRANFLKFFFANAGSLLSFGGNAEGMIDSQTGIGAFIGIGIKYDFKLGISIFSNYYSKFHALIPFTSNKYQQHILDNGLQFGITYNI